MLKIMKKKKNSLFKKLIFTLLFGISSVCLLGGWTYDNDSITFENKFDYDVNDIVSYSTSECEVVTTDSTYTLTNNLFEKTNNNYKFDLSYDSNNYIVGSVDEVRIQFEMNFSRSITLESLDCLYVLPYLIFTSYENNNYNFDIRDSLSEFEFSVDIEYKNQNVDYYSTWLDNRYWAPIMNGNYCYSLAEAFEYNGNPTTIDSLYFSLILDFEDNDYTLENSFLCDQLYFCLDNVMLTNYNNLSINNISNTSTYYAHDILLEEINTLNQTILQLQNEYNTLLNEYNTLINSVGNTLFDISQYSVSVGSVPNQVSFNYTLGQNLTNNFTNIGYLNVSDIYTNYIQSGNNNTIYITTPQSNLLTFDMTFNFITQPNTTIKTTLTLPNGNTQQFLYSSTDFNYKGEWSLANFVASSTIGENYDINDISYKDVLITWENIGNTLSDIKLGSNNGYNTGFNNGYNTALDRINELTTELNEKTSQLETATTELYAKTIQYEHLYTRFQQLSDTPLQLNFQTLLWNIASTPFEAFKNMWNFNFLGFNIAQFVTR